MASRNWSVTRKNYRKRRLTSDARILTWGRCGFCRPPGKYDTQANNSGGGHRSVRGFHPGAPVDTGRSRAGSRSPRRATPTDREMQSIHLCGPMARDWRMRDLPTPIGAPLLDRLQRFPSRFQALDARPDFNSGFWWRNPTLPWRD
jgi:hypothetical protein